jgi:para-aminobenzoate synthetase/4-amino-4-deoxychorismate lyase
MLSTAFWCTGARPLYLTSRVTIRPQNIRAVVYDSFAKQWLSFQNPSDVLVCHDLHAIPNTLYQVEEKTAAGNYAVGFLSYEAAPAFDPAFVVKPSDFPLAAFAVFQQAEKINLADLAIDDFQLEAAHRSISKDKFDTDIRAIKKYIAHGDTYQVNYTHRLMFDFIGEAFSIFSALIQDRPPAYAAFFEWQDFALCSLSPELFFKQDGHVILGRPMKGTRPRGRFYEEDQQLKEELFHSKKDRAENVMIVDMIRNDIGRIADTGSVKVEELYAIEKYPTVWQMTSTVSARTSADLFSTMQALFPCASITGAPKVRTMQIIKELETRPRQIYTGTIGLLKPNRQYQFNVAIRTLQIDKKNQTAEYGVGSGIVWDSDTEGEWGECQVKSRVLKRQSLKFDVLETMLYEQDDGIFLLDYHLARLQKSADYFDYPFALKKIKTALQQVNVKNSRQKIRLLLANDGSFRIERYDQPETKNEPVRLRLARSPIDSENIFIYHKTTQRQMYVSARQSMPDCDDVILWNEKYEITETTISNIILKFNGHFFTPPIECGLLGGTYRAWMLDRGEAHERILTMKDVHIATEIYVINSVLGKRKAVLLSD